jgi:polysaccharide export outer membrane protein
MINERLTILEALAQTSRSEPDDRRDKVWVIRESETTREYGKINLSSSSMFESPYFYLKNNDVVYIPPGKTSSQWRAAAPIFQFVGVVLGIVAVVVAITN